MNGLVFFLLLLLQVIIVFTILLQLSMLSYRRHDENQPKYYRRKFFIDLFLSFMMIVCFYNGAKSYTGPFENHPAYLEYTGLSLTSLFLYWLLQFLEYRKLKVPSWLSITILGLFFWVCLIPTIKLNVLVVLCWFPFYGMMVITPFLFLLSALTEISQQRILKGNIGFLKSIGLGLIPILIFQIAMNYWVEEQWALLHYVNLKNTF